MSAKKKATPTGTVISDVSIQMGPTNSSVTPEVARAIEALANASVEHGKAISKIAEALRGTPVYVNGNGITVGVP